MTDSYEKTVGIIADAHHPFAEDGAYYAAMKYLKEQQLTELVILGDFVDFYKISAYMKTENRGMSFKEEIDLDRGKLEEIRSEFPDIPITYIEGNHEERLWKHLINKSDELYDLKELTVPSLLKLKEHRIKYVANLANLVKGKEPFMRGGVVLAHGPDVIKSGGGIHIARTYLMKAHCDIVVGHHHTPSSHRIKTLSGDSIRAWSCGCLCKLSQSFMPHNQWGHGFLILHYNSKQRPYQPYMRTIEIDKDFKIRE